MVKCTGLLSSLDMMIGIYLFIIVTICQAFSVCHTHCKDLYLCYFIYKVGHVISILQMRKWRLKLRNLLKVTQLMVVELGFKF